MIVHFEVAVLLFQLLLIQHTLRILWILFLIMLDS